MPGIGTVLPMASAAAARRPLDAARWRTRKLRNAGLRDVGEASGEIVVARVVRCADPERVARPQECGVSVRSFMTSLVDATSVRRGWGAGQRQGNAEATADLALPRGTASPHAPPYRNLVCVQI